MDNDWLQDEQKQQSACLEESPDEIHLGTTTNTNISSKMLKENNMTKTS